MCNAILYLFMDNSVIIKQTFEFQSQLKQEIHTLDDSKNELSWSLWKLVIMTEVALRSLTLNCPIQDFEMTYFDTYTAVARYFRDLKLDWVANGYKEIAIYIGKYYWPNKANSELLRNLLDVPTS